MLAPLSWIKEYVDVTLPAKELGDKLTEIGLSTEKIIKTEDDTIFELEITPNRPDLLSIVGVAREIAAVEKKSVKFPKLKTTLKPGEKILPFKILGNPKINPRFSAIIIKGITVKQSPEWLKKRLEKIGQRTINNVVDITNYIMFELGNPVHSFDYDKIAGHLLKVHQTKGGEEFKSVDGISYRLPKDTVVISDAEKIIDLCGIKGGYNSGSFENTKNILIRVPVEIPTLIRRASQKLGLRSDASAIFERATDAGGTLNAIKRTVDLILEIAGGEVASQLYDIKEETFEPWKLTVRKERLNKILGIEIPTKQALSILDSLNLSPKETNDGIQCEVPTYRNDLKIEEDLIEEVARLYGYNNFSKTMPIGQIPAVKIPYFKDYKIEEKVKRILTSSGFSEVYTYSLISEKSLEDMIIKAESVLRVDNPVSREFEYLRPSIKSNLINALDLNKSNFPEVNIFELGKVYTGKTIENPDEHYALSGISNAKSFYEVKGILNLILQELGIDKDITESIELLNEGIFFELNFSEMEEKANTRKLYKPLPKYPPVVEDITFVLPASSKLGRVIEEIKKQSSLVTEVLLIDEFGNSKTFRIIYQSATKNLTNEEVSEIRKKIVESIKTKFAATVK